MEVIGNSSTPKEPKPQSPPTNNCRLPHNSPNLACNPTPRNRAETTDVGLLVACKIQLSSEVIRWKTETLRLQKERDSVQSHARDLDQKISKLNDRTKELEARLSQAEEENRHLRSRSDVNDEERAALVYKLSQSVNKYHSYPCGDGSPKSSRVSRLQVTGEEEASEDWREVSQKMLQKMKQEMKELHEMSIQFHNEDKDVSSDVTREKECQDEVKEGMSCLLSETESLKHLLLTQRQKLRYLLAELTSDDSIQRPHPNTPTRTQDFSEASVNMQSPAAKQKLNPRPHSNKSPVYLTKQLETLDDLNKAYKGTSAPSSSPTGASVSKPNSKQKRHSAVLRDEPQEEKVCPICQASFNGRVSQAQFEEHVLNHLETESTSLLDQYVVL